MSVHHPSGYLGVSLSSFGDGATLDINQGEDIPLAFVLAINYMWTSKLPRLRERTRRLYILVAFAYSISYHSIL